MTAARTFQRTREDFICGHCGAPNSGNGYTNHCRNCLWSRHVDVNPGDRAAGCGALMAPVGLDVTGGHEVILHRCTAPGCGHTRKNKASADDDRQAIVDLSCGLCENPSPAEKVRRS